MGAGERSEYIEGMYDSQATTYAAFKEASFAWRYIERPAFDRYLTGADVDLPNLYEPDTQVLDVGCGSGLVVEHLISHGIHADNIVGIDLSSQLIEEATRRIQGVHFFRASADNFNVAAESIGLATSNMVFHYLDNEQLQKAFSLIYDALEPGGTLFFVDADPDYSEETRRPENVDQWLELPTPWGGTAPWFSRDPYTLLLDMTYFAGFDMVAGSPLPVSEEGKAFPAEYSKYMSYPARMAARLQKVPEDEKQRRIEGANEQIPRLAE
jgi:SAM-dependent methyltransferase